MEDNSADAHTAQAFANSWNNLPAGSVYTEDQFEDWLSPLTRREIEGRKVLELGCGNAGLLVHMSRWNPKYLEGVDLGDSVQSAERNMRATQSDAWKITRSDLNTFVGEPFDVVYCIGVLHHLQSPKAGFDSVLRNTRPGGRFHCWVYAREGNGIVVHVVDPIRKVASRLPWWFTKHVLATFLVIPYYAYAKLLAWLPSLGLLRRLPLYEYSKWIAKRGFWFFRHVAFDQLVAPQTTYIDKETVSLWLADPRIRPGSEYLIFRNGNSWKFGGIRA